MNALTVLAEANQGRSDWPAAIVTLGSLVAICFIIWCVTRGSR